jgi:hypothetical protein
MGDFLLGEACDEAHFHHPGLAGVDRFQTFEGFVQGQKLHCSNIDPDGQIGERNPQTRLGAFVRLPRPSVIDEDTAHQLCGYRKKMGSAFPIDAALGDQSEVNFVNKISCLKAVFAEFPQHAPGCHPVELVVNDAE